LAGAAIVNPDSRAIRTEQQIRAVTEDVEARGQAERGRQAGRKFIEQGAHIALQLVALSQVEQFESGDERVADFGNPAINLRRRLPHPDREQPKTIGSTCQRHEDHGRGFEPSGKFGHPRVGVGDQQRNTTVEGGADQRQLMVFRQPGVGSQRLETVT
jgi:hypothetical protein